MSTTPVDVERWLPSLQQIAAANLTAFLRSAGVADYAALLASVREDLPGFYERIVRTLDLRWDVPWESVLDRSHGKAFATWFAGAQFNAAANCLDRHIDAGRGAAQALLWEGEDGTVRALSFFELRAEVRALAGTLRDLGVAPGDTVGIFMPMLPETAIGLLAIAYLGAIAVPAFFGLWPGCVGRATRRRARQGAAHRRRGEPARQTC